MQDGQEGPFLLCSGSSQGPRNAWIYPLASLKSLPSLGSSTKCYHLAITTKVFAEMSLNNIPPQILPLYQQKKNFFFFSPPWEQFGPKFMFCHWQQQVWSTPPARKRSSQTLTHWQASFQPKQTSRMKCPICLQIKHMHTDQECYQAHLVFMYKPLFAQIGVLDIKLSQICPAPAWKEFRKPRYSIFLQSFWSLYKQLQYKFSASSLRENKLF